MTLLQKSQLFLAILSFSFYGNTQQTSSDAPTYNITFLENEPQIDGEIINEELWQEIPLAQDLIQIKPNYGAPVSEKTAIRIAYSKTTFYVAVVCYDSEPEKLVVSDSRRDADLNDEDSFLFIIDTYHDRLNGFLFGTNAQGMEYDAQIDNEGKGNFNANRQQGGVIEAPILTGMPLGKYAPKWAITDGVPSLPFLCAPCALQPEIIKHGDSTSEEISVRTQKLLIGPPYPLVLI